MSLHVYKQTAENHALTAVEKDTLWRQVKIAPSVHDREQIEAAFGSILATRTANLGAALDVVDSLTTAAEYRARLSLSRDFEGNPPPALVPASDLRAAMSPVIPPASSAEDDR